MKNLVKIIVILAIFVSACFVSTRVFSQSELPTQPSTETLPEQTPSEPPAQVPSDETLVETPEETPVTPPTENPEEKPNESPEETPIEPPVELQVTEKQSYSEGIVVVENLKIEATDENADAIYAENEGTIVTINSGYYDGGDNGSTTAVYARDGAKVIINGGTFKAGEGCAAIYAKNNAIVEINGGHFEVDGPYLDNYFVLNLSDNTNSQIIVKGGTFVNFNPADNKSENPAISFVAEGYTVTSETQQNGDVWYTVIEEVQE